ncbi:MAG: hypothetical protein IJB26_03480 [Clostridia bacterium]|nr:hypothetical protein [Clostridia bacterium]
MKKILSLILALCMMATLACGCGQTEDTSSSTDVSAATSVSLTLQDVKDSITELANTFGFSKSISLADTKAAEGNALTHTFDILNDNLVLVVTEKDGLVKEIYVGNYWELFKTNGKTDEEAIAHVKSVSAVALGACTGITDMGAFENGLWASPQQNGEYTNYEYSQGGWLYKAAIGPQMVTIAAFPQE